MIGKPSELIAESLRARAEQAQKGEQEKASGAAIEKGVKEKPLKGQINIFDETPGEGSAPGK